MEEVKQVARSEIIKYFKQCESGKKVPNLHIVDKIWDTIILGKRQMISEIYYNENALDYYTEFCFVIWKFISQTKVFIDEFYNKSAKQRLKQNLKRHVLSVLYSLKNGYTQGTHVIHSIYKKDKYLEENLYVEGDLKLIGKNIKYAKKYSKNDITQGNHIVFQCFRSMNNTILFKLSEELNSLRNKFINN